jgi:hypothetical protein
MTEGQRQVKGPFDYRKSAHQRFEQRYTPAPNSGCWLWTDATMKRGGYGQMSAFGKPRPAHRISWMLYRGEIPPGKFVCHKCDVPLCVNPDHLFLGTPSDNMQDCSRKGRLNLTIRHRKLTFDQARAIKNSKEPQQRLAARYGVDQALISRIRTGRCWKVL